MKKIFRKSLLAITMVSLFANSIEAASFVDNMSVSFNPGITPAPSIVVPFAPITAPSLTLKNAFNEFKSVSKAERNNRVKEVKKELKEYKKAKKAGKEPSTNTLLLVILAILLPPLAVYLHEGEINNKFWIAVLLTLLFFLPGVIYALVVVLGDEK
ncbi:MAG: YqaE/Pmp3 family membrane protein [Ferruginibacter sp.]